MYITEQHNPRLPYLREKTSNLTTSPGCYLMKDKQGKIIYIGKAKNLKNRVTSYFRAGQDHLPKVWKMVSLVFDYDFIVTNSEFEALVLECSLIKQNTPKYNILLKDSKGYSYIKVSDEEYPRITFELQKNGEGTFIGPYTSTFTANQSVIEANKVFKLPTCKRKFPQDFKKQRPCLNHHIKQCMGVCTGEISRDEYRDVVNQAVEYIKSGSAVSCERLTQAMNEAAENLQFEQAAKLRDRIVAIKKAAEKQMMVQTGVKDTDIIAVSQNTTQAAASVLMYRGGRLFDKLDFMLGEIEESSAMRQSFLLQYYSDKDDIPPEVLIDEPCADMELCEQFLRERSKRAVKLSSPQRGAPLSLMMLAKNNATEYLANKVGRTKREVTALEELAKALGMKNTPEYIECYDISNLASSDMVAGMVVFENGRPLKKAYKRFSIKTVAEQNDYACMREVLSRRFTHYHQQDDEYFSKMPDLVLLDGGKGHVAAVLPVIRELGVNCAVYGLVKDSNHRTRGIVDEDGREILISKHKSAFMLLTQIQDEVHRFAISYQKKKRSKSLYELELTKIKGIGVKKAQAILAHYKTKELLKEATVEEIMKIAGVNEQIASEVVLMLLDI